MFMELSHTPDTAATTKRGPPVRVLEGRASSRPVFVALVALSLCSCEVKMKEPKAPQVAKPEPVPVPVEQAVREPAPEAPPPEQVPESEVAPPIQVVEVKPEPWAPEKLSDDQLLDKVQRQTFRYFWDFGHPVSGLARERDRSGSNKVRLLPLPSSMLSPPGGQPGEEGLLAEYFNNPNFEGTPVIKRVDRQVNMNWSEDDPGSGMPIDGFSVRWTGTLRVPKDGPFPLAIGSDDGARLYVNGQLLLDTWGDHGFEIAHKTIQLAADTPYPIRLDYYEKGGSAAVQLGRVMSKDEVATDNTVDTGGDVCAIGGTGMGIMSTIVASERKWITRQQAAERVLKIVSFLEKADRFHGAFPHWMNGKTGKAIPFTPKDNGGDLVETSYVVEGMLCARQYFNGGTPAEARIRSIVSKLWDEVDWKFYTRDQNLLFWHWSPTDGWAMQHGIGGWNECLITYVLAASSPKHAINPNVYHEGWAKNGGIKNGREFFGIKLPLGWDFGGPLFFAHYTFMGLDPRNLEDRYANYWEQNVNHTAINRAYCVQNPKNFKGYGAHCWGLTASDNHNGYGAHSPTDDIGVISPTAALSSFPYTPGFSMQALRHFYYDLGDKLWSEYGFIDAFSEEHNWYAQSHLAIDQGPIIVMIENHRTGLMWKLFMSVPEVQQGLRKLGFKTRP